MGRDVYTCLSEHISKLAVGPPHNDYLIQILRESLSEGEAKLLLNLPTQVAPFEPITAEQLEILVDFSTLKIEETLNRLAERGLLFKGRNKNGEFGYALHQFGFGMPQAIFWPNEDTPYARRMADLCIRHSSSEVLTKAFGGTSTKVFRWIPINRELGANKQAILPYARIDEVIAKTTVIAQVNCNCRVMSRLKGRDPCKYPLDVCMKYDDLAEYVIHVGIGRKLSQDEAMAINRKAEEAGCVHFADNVVEGEIKHACNCCPCCCWALGNYKRRRVPRDLLMACQFVRDTDLETCVGCEACVDACPIDAVEMKNGLPAVDSDWCIGCGVCATNCPTESIKMVRRHDIEEPLPSMKSLSMDRMNQKTSAPKS
jgi:Pyruvate/2-oxoacid:ferredoxin oxidoreductase delta subunit